MRFFQHSRRKGVLARSRLTVERLEDRELLDAASAAQFITGLYYDLLHRAPGQGEVANWTGWLYSGHARADAATAIINSTEYRLDLIRHDYESFLGREPDVVAIQGWLKSLAQGMTQRRLLLDIVASPEYYQHSGGTNAAWVIELYHDVLNRAPDSARLTSFVHQLDRGITLKSIAIDVIFGSDEDNRIITTAYKALLGRSPDAGAVSQWSTAFHQGHTTEQLLEALASSPEYLDQQSGVNVALDVGAPGSGIPAAGSPSLSITLKAPAFTTNVSPFVTVTVSDPNFEGRVRIDVDSKHNGSFTDPGDSSQTTALINPQKHRFELNYLGRGRFQIRARVFDIFGNLAASQILTVVIDPFAGIVGSQQLVNLRADYMTTLHAVGDDSHAMPRAFFTSRTDIFTFDEQGRVKVNIRATLNRFVNDLAKSLAAWGMNIISTTPSQGITTGYLPIARITDLPSLPYYAAVTPSYAVVHKVGSATTQGDAVIMADVFRSNYNVTGQGITIGIISDSANQVNGGIAQSQSTGDLPPQGVQVLKDGPSGSTDEGRAMAEIIHDVAPGANLAFYTGVDSPQDFANGILQLANAGAKIIVDDIGWTDSPMFNDGVIAQAVDQVRSEGVFYASAAGNDGNQGFIASWSGAQTTVAGNSGTFFNIGGGNVLQGFTLQPGQSFQLDFQWDNAFLEGGSSNANFQVQTEVDVLVTTADGSRVLADFNDNTLNTNEAVQIGNFTNDGSFGTNNFAFAFMLKQGPAPTTLRWIASGDDPHAAGEGFSTIYGQPAAKGAMAVGAVPWYSPRESEPFSALGGAIPILFDAQGNRLAHPEYRVKPDVAAPDGVDTSFFGSPAPNGNPDQHPRFFGTSAAAPHVAAAVALLMQQFPGVKVGQLRKHLEDTAVPVNNSSSANDVAGSGLIQLAPIITPPTPPPIQPPPLTPGEDRFEFNDSSNLATPLGGVSSQTITGLSIFNHANGLQDADWFEMGSSVFGHVSVTMNYTTLQPGTDLNIRVFQLDSTGILRQLGAGTQANSNEQTVSFDVTPGMLVFIWVYGFNGAQGNYQLTLNVA
jgi:hypothetical protein